jgi:hypothetical protein
VAKLGLVNETPGASKLLKEMTRGRPAFEGRREGAGGDEMLGCGLNLGCWHSESHLKWHFSIVRKDGSLGQVNSHFLKKIKILYQTCSKVNLRFTVI